MENYEWDMLLILKFNVIVFAVIFLCQLYENFKKSSWKMDQDEEKWGKLDFSFFHMKTLNFNRWESDFRLPCSLSIIQSWNVAFILSCPFSILSLNFPYDHWQGRMFSSLLFYIFSIPKIKQEFSNSRNNFLT